MESLQLARKKIVIMPMELRNHTEEELLLLYGSILKELRGRGVIRTSNLLGDYAEWLVAKRLHLELAANSTAGYDAYNDAGQTYQIKARRLTPTNPSRELSKISSLEPTAFDYLVGVLFNADFSILHVYRIPRDVVKKHAKDKKKGWIIYLQGSLLEESDVVELTHIFIDESETEDEIL
jgi:hypothetical protein